MTKLEFGEQLRQARERRGISLRQIASATKISIGALEALERNDISRLPGGIFSRAFVRSYAIEIGLDPEQTVREFLGHFPSEGTGLGGHPHEEDEEVAGADREMTGLVIKLLGVSIPLAAIILYFSLSGGGSASTAPSSDAVSPPVATAGSEPAPIDAAVGGSGDVPVVAGTGAVGNAVPAPGSAPSGTRAGGALTIEVRPTGPCWVSLTVDGRVLISRVMYAGEREAHGAREEIVLQVGDAGRFAFEINGRPGRPLGGAGEVVRLRIDPENYRTYVRESL